MNLINPSAKVTKINLFLQYYTFHISFYFPRLCITRWKLFTHLKSFLEGGQKFNLPYLCSSSEIFKVSVLRYHLLICLRLSACASGWAARARRCYARYEGSRAGVRGQSGHRRAQGGWTVDTVMVLVRV